MTLPASLSLEQASRDCWDVVVVGAGPAGAVVAGELARRGSVLLVDQAAFPRSKVCGCCLNGRALAALAEAGLSDVPARLGGVELHTFLLAAGGRTASLRLPGGMAASRLAFDAALVEAARARGAEFLPSTRATLLHADEPHQRRLLLRQPGGEAEVSARVVVAADGLGGTLLAREGSVLTPRPGSRIGAGVVVETGEGFYRPGVVYMSCGHAGYVGLVRLEDGRLDVACALDPAAARERGGVAPLAVEQLARAGWPVPAGLIDAPWRGTPALTRSAGCVAQHRLFALGDATGYVEPFTGEGMAWALTSAVALAPLASRAARAWEDGFVSAWARRHRRIVTRRQGACRIAAAVLRRPWLTAAAVALLSRLPGLAWPVLHHLNTSPLALRETQ